MFVLIFVELVIGRRRRLLCRVGRRPRLLCRRVGRCRLLLFVGLLGPDILGPRPAGDRGPYAS